MIVSLVFEYLNALEIGAFAAIPEHPELMNQALVRIQIIQIMHINLLLINDKKLMVKNFHCQNVCEIASRYLVKLTQELIRLVDIIVAGCL